MLRSGEVSCRLVGYPFIGAFVGVSHRMELFEHHSPFLDLMVLILILSADQTETIVNSREEQVKYKSSLSSTKTCNLGLV